MLIIKKLNLHISQNIYVVEFILFSWPEHHTFSILHNISITFWNFRIVLDIISPPILACFAIFYPIASIRIHKVNRIIGTISVWRGIIVLFCQWVLLEEDGGGRVVEPGAEVEEGLVSGEIRPSYRRHTFLCQRTYPMKEWNTQQELFKSLSRRTPFNVG